MMKRLKTALVLFALLLSTACGNSVNSKIDELAAKPKATTLEGAKALYDEVGTLIDWVQNPSSPEKATPEELAKAKALQATRFDEGVALGGEKFKSSVKKLLDAIGLEGVDLPNIDKKAGEAKDWVLGVDNPDIDKFKPQDNREPLDKRGAKGWP